MKYQTVQGRNNVFLKWMMLGFCVLFLSLLFGLLALTGSAVFIGLGAALVIGPVLLLLPELTVWIILVVGFLFGVVAANPQLSKLVWTVSMLSLLLLIPALSNSLWSRERKLPAYLYVAILFLAMCIFSSVLRGAGIGEFIFGFKRYFQAYGLMIALVTIVFSVTTMRHWRKYLLIIGLLQFPFCLYELLILVPKRGGLAGSSEATDVVAGTFGANMVGGSPSGVMVIYLFIVLAFLVSRWRLNLMTGRTFAFLAGICALPLAMGESKIAVIMLPLVGMSLLRKDFLRQPLRYFPAILAIVGLTVLLGYIYVVVYMHSDVSHVISSTLRYNVGDQGYGNGQILNRTTAISFWFSQQNWYDPLGFMFGNGLGSSYSSLSGSGHLGIKYSHYGIALTAASSLLWDTGVVGFTLFMGIFVLGWFAAEKLYKKTEDALVKAEALAIQASMLLFMLGIFYFDSIVNLVSMELIYAVVLGYLGYLMNTQRVLESKQISRKIGGFK